MADSKEEALATTYALLNDDPKHRLNKTIVLTSTESIDKIISENSDFIVVIFDDAIIREYSGNYKNVHSILIRPKNTSSHSGTCIKTTPLSYTNFDDLHSLSVPMDGAGVSLPEITVDFDGDTRDPLTPDIGCDEYTVPVDDGAVGLVYHLGEVPVEG